MHKKGSLGFFIFLIIFSFFVVFSCFYLFYDGIYFCCFQKNYKENKKQSNKNNQKNY